jgi:pimeloyl-ACP methyl ester carboxylesterase
MFRILRNSVHVPLLRSDDQALPLSRSDALRKLIRPEFLLVDGAGHLPHYERPEAVNPRLIEFLARKN